MIVIEVIIRGYNKMQNLTLRDKYLALTGYGQSGGKYCNAIDEDLYNSSDWANTMPPSGYSFRTLESGKVSVIYTNYFTFKFVHDNFHFSSFFIFIFIFFHYNFFPFCVLLFSLYYLEQISS